MRFAKYRNFFTKTNWILFYDKKQTFMKYTLALPKKYTKISLPYLKVWVEALRSGRYQNGTPYLRDAKLNNYSCLGVLVTLQNRLVEYSSKDRTNYFDDFVDEKVIIPDFTSLSITNPCYTVLGKAGDFPMGVVLQYRGKLGGCLQAADSEGLSFKDISDILEKLYE